MECPQCKKELQKGYISTGYSLKWYRDNVEMDEDFKESVRLCKRPVWENEKVESFYCSNCRVIVIPIPDNIDGNKIEKVKEKWNQLRGNVEDKYTDFKSHQEEKHFQKRQEERRKKDPWEV